MSMLYALKARFSLRRTKADLGALYTAKREIDPEQEGSYPLSQAQAALVVRIIRNLGHYLHFYNQRVAPEDRVSEESLGVFLKLQFLNWAMTDPSLLGEDVPTAYWASMDRIVRPRLDASRKGIIYAQNTAMIDRIVERYRSLGYNVARIDGTVTGPASENGEPVLDPRGRPVSARAHERHRFQNDPTVNLVVVNVRAAVGVQLDRASWQLYAQLPVNYVEYYQSSDRPLGLVRPGENRDVETMFMVARYPADFLAEALRSGDAATVEAGTPAQILYRSLMGEQKTEFDLVMEGILPRFASSPERALSRLVGAIHGFLQDPSLRRAGRRRRGQMAAVDAFHDLYTGSSDRAVQRALLALADDHARAGVDARPFVAALGPAESLDAFDLRFYDAVFRLPNKAHREIMARLLPDIATAARLGANGLRGAIDRSAAPIRALAEDHPSLFLTFVAAARLGPLSGGTEHPGSRVLVDLVDDIQRADVSMYESRRTLERAASALIPLITLHDHRLLDLFESLLPDLSGEDVAVERRIRLLESLALLREASAADYERVLAFRGGLAGLERELETTTDRVFFSLFDLPADAGTRDHVARLARGWGGLGVPLRMAAKLRAGGAETADHLSLFQRAIRHLVAGDLAAWRNDQDRDPTDHEITYRADDPAFWRVFNRREIIELGTISVKTTDQRRQRRHLETVLSGLLNNDAALEAAFGPVGAAIKADTADADAARAIEERRAVLGGERGRLIESDDAEARAAADALGAELDDLSLRARLLRVRAALAAGDASQAGRELRALSLIIEERKPGEEPEIAVLARELAEAVSNDGRRRFEDLQIEITDDPQLILQRGMLDPDMRNCFNLEAHPRQIAALVDDLIARNKMLVVVRSAGRPVSVAVVKVREGVDGQTLLHIERPLYRWGYGFEPEIARALLQTKIPEMTGTSVSTDRPLGSGAPAPVRARSTGTRGPTEYHESLFGVRPRRARVAHRAYVVAPATPAAAAGTPSLTANLALLFPGRWARSAEFVVRVLLFAAIIPHEMGHRMAGWWSGRDQGASLSWRHYLSGMPWETTGGEALAGLAVNFLLSAGSAFALSLVWSVPGAAPLAWIAEALLTSNVVFLLAESALTLRLPALGLAARADLRQARKGASAAPVEDAAAAVAILSGPIRPSLMSSVLDIAGTRVLLQLRNSRQTPVDLVFLEGVSRSADLALAEAARHRHQAATDRGEHRTTLVIAPAASAADAVRGSAGAELFVAALPDLYSWAEGRPAVRLTAVDRLVGPRPDLQIVTAGIALDSAGLDASSPLRRVALVLLELLGQEEAWRGTVDQAIEHQRMVDQQA
jgi:hypothetical protein